MAVRTAERLALTRRPRRLRRTETIRSLVRETRLSADCFIYPLFVCEGKGIRREVTSMPGVFQLSVDEAVKEVAAASREGVPGVILFGLPDSKNAHGSLAADPDAPVQRAVRALKQELPSVVVMTDVCLCEYTSHGHCGIVDGEEIVNDVTVEHLVDAALSHAVAGADFVAPSDMMDGRVGAIRRALDERGHEGVGIMSYAAKYCSAFYGPFRDAADSAPQFGDRRSAANSTQHRNPSLPSILAATTGHTWARATPARRTVAGAPDPHRGRSAYLAGNDRAKAAPRSTHSASASSVAMPDDSTYTNPFMGRPVKSMGRAWGNARAASKLSGPGRTIRSLPVTPTAIFLPTMKQRPPNIFFSV